MEKFYIVTNPEFLKEIEDYKANTAAQKVLVNEFFNDHEIAGSEYHVCGNGLVNTSFTERDKHNIRLYILGCEENNKKFGKELLKPVKLFCDSDVKMRSFRANSKTLKAFQDLCIERKIAINIHSVRIGDYFKELHYGGYTASRFEYKGKHYLQIIKNDCDSFTPEHDGFNEIKGSKYYTILEQFEAEKETNNN